MKPFSLFVRILLALLAVTLVEKIIFATYHRANWTDLPFIDVVAALGSGLRFDAALAAALATAPVLAAYVWRRLARRDPAPVARVVTYLAVAGLIGVHGADLLYFAETGRHMGYEIKEAYNSRAELVATALGTYALPTGLQLLAFAAGIWGVRRAVPSAPQERRMFAPDRHVLQYFALEAKMLGVIGIAAVIARGGLQSVPLEPLHAQGLGDTRKATIALNGTYNALFSALTPYAVQPLIDGPPTEEQIALVRSLYPAHTTPRGAGDKRNVIIIFLESWSAQRMASYGATRETTPYFDALLQNSFSAREMLAGGHRTTEGLFATLCSAQNPLGGTIAQTQLQNHRYECLPGQLRQAGYATAFFQGTVSGTSGTGAFAQMLGFEQSFGKEHVADYRLPHNSWGLHDPDIYSFALSRMAELPQPFLVGINTNSTHDHKLPPGTATPFGTEKAADRYDNALRFSDTALRDFMTEVETHFPGAVVIALADHAGPSSGDTVQAYRIPFLIHAPGKLAPGQVDVASQRDVTPTVLDLLGLGEVPWYTGQSLLRKDAPRMADFFHAGVIGWVEAGRAVEFPLREKEPMRCFDSNEHFTPVSCDGSAAAAREHALAFTTVSQRLLFDGRLMEFASLRAP